VLIELYLYIDALFSYILISFRSRLLEFILEFISESVTGFPFIVLRTEPFIFLEVFGLTLDFRLDFAAEFIRRIANICLDSVLLGARDFIIFIIY
jgi:hypothetical protein